MRQKLNLITLGVSDLGKSLEFYEKGLNWEKSPSSTGDLILFKLGGMVLALYPRKRLAEDVTVEDSPTGFSGSTFSYNAQSESEVDEVIEEVKNLGAEIVKPPQKVFWGGYSGYFKDPDGHLFEVAFNPLWGFDENDDLDLP
ncbi:VOC family protein [Methanobacterium sp.]|uniref:VOC family protein n=1 Tax=Methanobacterium sp. TaxID=2164 RepID=UPI0025EFD14E|nr:VOC family protein [Methanobacterium sp.]MBI5460223.1 VOC family protein [Methanobacterium sp.]